MWGVFGRQSLLYLPVFLAYMCVCFCIPACLSIYLFVLLCVSVSVSVCHFIILSLSYGLCLLACLPDRMSVRMSAFLFVH